MKTFFAQICLLSFFPLLNAQHQGQEDYYTRLTVKNFRKDSFFNQPVDFSNPDYHRLNAAIFFATNEQRLKKKLPLVSYASRLEEVASMHSKDMCDKNFFNHVNPTDKKKRTPNDRARLHGIDNPYIAENLATAFGLQYDQGRDVIVKGPGKFSYPGKQDLILPNTYLQVADVLINSWMHSEGHRKNILSANALQLGCGTYLFLDKKFNQMPTFMATQNFQEYEKIETSR